jgi:hypothetical protein
MFQGQGAVFRESKVQRFFLSTSQIIAATKLPWDDLGQSAASPEFNFEVNKLYISNIWTSLLKLYKDCYIGTLAKLCTLDLLKWRPGTAACGNLPLRKIFVTFMC